jgi:Ca2+-binding RTX toxin-like protein
MAARGCFAAALAIACAGLLAPPALAGTAGGTATTLSYKAWAGEANHISLSWDAKRVTLSDPGALLILGCSPLGLNKVSCRRPDGPVFSGCDAACHANVALGDGNDWGVIDNAPDVSGLSVLLDGGAGNDFLIANRGTISGGAGDDTLVAVTGVSGHADFVCGPGEDYATARPGDSVAADCEHVARPAGATARKRL